MPRILVVDDSLDMLKLCERTLESQGHEVATATSIALARKALKAGSLDLLIVDVVMPDLGGFDYLLELKKGGIPHPPIIMLTGRTTSEDVLKALDLGAIDYICKPFDREVFLSKVHSALGLTRELTFTSRRVDREAFILKPTLISSITEDGLTLISEKEFTVSEALRLRSSLFKEIGITPPPLRVLDCRVLGNNTFEVTLSFVGIDENSMKKVRQWIIQQNMRRNKAA